MCLNIVCCTGVNGHQYAKQRESDIGSSDFEDRSFGKEEAQSLSEGSFENGVDQEVDGSESDSGIRTVEWTLNCTLSLLLFVTILQ